MGISPRRYKALAFAMAAAFGGAAGWLYVYTVGFISPVELDLLLGINLLAVMIVGGMGSVLGSLLGGVLYVYIPVLAGTLSPARTTLLYGAILLLVLFFAPGGLARAIRRVGDRLDRLLWSARGTGSPGSNAAAAAGDVPASPAPQQPANPASPAPQQPANPASPAPQQPANPASPAPQQPANPAMSERTDG
jgi:branched-chain amino acid transport system permease protein